LCVINPNRNIPHLSLIAAHMRFSRAQPVL